MTTDSLLTLALAILVFGASPGPGIFAVVARALSQGFGAAMAMTGGLILGDLVFLTLAVSGMSALAATMGEAFLVLKLAGGAYLVWLGVKAWRTEPVPVGAAETGAAAARGPLRSFLGGFVVTLSNPKAILFYAAILPTILDLQAIDAAGLVAAGAVVAAVLLVVCAGYALLAAGARGVFTSSKAMRRLNRVSGALLMGAGVAIAAR